MQESFFQTLFNHLTEPHIVVKADSPKFTIVACNDMYRIISGIKDREIIGKGIQEIGSSNTTNDESHKIIHDALTKAISEGSTVKLSAVRYDIPAANGKIEDPAWWQVTYSPISINGDQVDHILCTICNITERVINQEAVQKALDQEKAFRTIQTLNEELKESQIKLSVLKDELEQRVIDRTKALTESEERFREMIQQSPVAMLVTKGPDMIFEVVNQSMLDMLAKDRSIVGKAAYTIMPELRSQPIMERLFETYNTAKEWTGYEQPIMLTTEGKLQQRYFNLSYKPLIEDGKTTGVLQSCVEVTEQVLAREAIAESERKIWDILNALPEIAWTNTPEGEVNFYNQQWYNYTGLNFETSKNWGWKDIIHPDDLQYNLDTYSNLLKNKQEGEFEIREKRADGNYRWHLVRMRPIMENQQVKLWVGTATDIEELKQVQQQKDDFISIASHELKTPITSLKASVQLLNRIKNDSFPKIAIDLINQSNKSMIKVSNLIEDLLNAGKYGSGQLTLHKEVFNLTDLINDCCLHITTEGIYTVKIEGDCTLQVKADAERIEQVITNLINNAIKYAPDSKEIRIKIEKVNDMAKISVIDKGPGIPADKLPYIFDRYYRIATPGYQNSGLGIGLYICMEIIKKHGAQIHAESEVGKGSIFWFTLPLN